MCFLVRCRSASSSSITSSLRPHDVNVPLRAEQQPHAKRFLQPRRTCSPSITITGSHHISLDLIYIPHIPLYPAISSSGYREKSAQGRDEILAIKFPFR